MKEPSITITENSQNYHVSAIQLIPNEEELHITVDKEWCNALHASLVGQVTKNTDGYDAIGYDISRHPPTNNIIVLESPVKELLETINFIESVLAQFNFIKPGTHKAITKQLQHTQEQNYSSKFFQEPQDAHKPDDDEDESDKQSLTRDSGGGKK